MTDTSAHHSRIVHRTLLVNGSAVRYELTRSPRKTLGITVRPDRCVAVTAPIDAAQERIEEILRRRIRWIRRQQQLVSELPPEPQPRRWISGETHRYLGRQYRLRVERGTRQMVRLRGGYFWVTVSKRENIGAVQSAIEGWYRARAQPLLERRVQMCLASTTFLDFEMPEVVIRSMRTRWGSYSPSGRILLNIDLVKIPLGCVDYVITHELCHAKVKDHGRRFQRLIGRCMPDWERHRDRLSKVEL